MSSVPLSKRLASEFFGTALLLAAIVGSGIMGERLAGSNVALALLCNTIPTAAILTVLITMLGPISGAHFNTSVSLVFWLRRELQARDFVLYSLVQIAGAVIGVFIAHLMFELPVLELSQKMRSGSGQWIAEFVASFGLVTTILATLRAKPAAVPLSVGLFITAAYWFTASTSFANPAVTFARSLTSSFAGIRMLDVPGFVAAQVAGGLAALALCRWLLGDTSHHSAKVTEPV